MSRQARQLACSSTHILTYLPTSTTMQEELILSNILGKPIEYVLSHDIVLSAAQRRRFDLAMRRLRKGEPLAYILGYRWFFGNKFEVNKDVLIPRPETEQLVELAIMRAKKTKPQIIADIGTGSGAITISVAKNLSATKSLRGTRFIATDISTKALAVAKKNAKNLKAKVLFKNGDLAKPILAAIKDKNILITANLPYLSKKQLREPSIKHEPKLALYGGNKAHQKIEQLTKQLATVNFASATILLEINYDQAKSVIKSAKKYLEDFQDIVIHKDLNGFDRIIEIIL